MADHRSLWPLLAYGALTVVAFARGPAPRARIRSRRDRSSRRPPPLRRQPPDQADAAHKAEGERGPQAVDFDRAHENGRGREAASPPGIPWRGWKDILWRAYGKMNDDRLLAVAGGVVFFSVLALFPALTALVSLYGLFADPSTIDQQVAAASGILPGGAVDIVHEELTRLASAKHGGLSAGAIIGLLVALWSANSGTKAIIDALNVAYEERETRSFVRLNLVSLAMTLVAIVSSMLAIGAVVAAPIILEHVGLGRISSTLISILRWPILLVLVVIGLAALYRYAPNRREPRWQWVSVGGVAAALLWVISSGLFSWYVASFGNYNATYGSLGAAMGMMMWMWISAIVILLGAQLNAEIEHQTARDSTVGPDKLLGKRGAQMADTVGAAQGP